MTSSRANHKATVSFYYRARVLYPHNSAVQTLRALCCSNNEGNRESKIFLKRKRVDKNQFNSKTEKANVPGSTIQMRRVKMPSFKRLSSDMYSNRVVYFTLVKTRYKVCRILMIQEKQIHLRYSESRNVIFLRSPDSRRIERKILRRTRLNLLKWKVISSLGKFWFPKKKTPFTNGTSDRSFSSALVQSYECNRIITLGSI